MAVIEAGGWTFSYDDVGSGDPMILLHGLLMDRTMWDYQVEAFRGTNRVVTVDLPGHGESPPQPIGFTAWDAARAMGAFADAIELGPAVWIGHSMGGFQIVRLALAEPDRIRGMVLADSSAGPENPELLPQYEGFLTVAKEDGVSDDLAGILAMLLFDASFLATPDGVHWVKRLAAQDVNKLEGGCRLVFDRDDVRDRAGEITAPTLVVHGTDDVSIPVAVAQDLVTRIPGARLVEIPGSGHTAPLEKPEPVNRAIEEFLRAL